LTGVTDYVNFSRGKSYQYDKLGRLKEARGGADPFNNPTWTQSYSYDRYGNRTGVAKSGPGAGSVPLDGLASLSFANGQGQTTSNRITTAGYEYDPAGNLTRGQTDNGVWLRYKYDAAGRLAQVLNDSSVAQETYSYGASNHRLMSVEGGVTTYYGWDGGHVIAEYAPSGSSGLQWQTGYVYLGGRLLATTNAGGTRFHHPDRLGTRLVTDQSNGEVVTAQLGMPFGTQQPAGAFGGDNSWQHPMKNNPSKKRFTSYDRSDTTGLDYAVNRFYQSAQGRFTQVDPIGMSAASLEDPQSLNLYSYCGNDPINHVDPDGLFLKKLFGGIGKAFKWAFRIAAVIVAVIAVMALSAIGQYWGAIEITRGVVALLFTSAGLLATAGWAPGRVGQIAGALITAGLSWGSNFRTPGTFPDGSGTGGVSNWVAKKRAKKSPRQYNPAKVAKAINDYVSVVKGYPDIFRNSHLKQIIANENSSGLDDRIIQCQVAAESRYNANAVGAAKEIGLLQVKPATAEGLGFDPVALKDPATNIRAGTLYLGQLRERFGNDHDALVAYNAGPRRFRQGRAGVDSFEYADQILNQNNGEWCGLQPARAVSAD
jgi:RHS repeat-associated protein